MSKILIVEDDQFIRELYERQIKLAGFSVDVAKDGKTTLELLDKNDYDLLMLDISLPDTTGLKILEQLKDSPKDGMAILMLSNMGDQELINQALNLGAQAYIIKSTYTPQKVVEEVKSLLN